MTFIEERLEKRKKQRDELETSLDSNIPWEEKKIILKKYTKIVNSIKLLEVTKEIMPNLTV